MQRSDVGKKHEKKHETLVLAAQKWCDRNGVLYLHAKTTKINGRYMSNTNKGAPDMFIFEPGMDRGAVRHALAVEFKIGKDTVKAPQLEWHRRLRANGYRYLPALPLRLPSIASAAAKSAGFVCYLWRRAFCLQMRGAAHRVG